MNQPHSSLMNQSASGLTLIAGGATIENRQYSSSMLSNRLPRHGATSELNLNGTLVSATNTDTLHAGGGISDPINFGLKGMGGGAGMSGLKGPLD